MKYSDFVKLVASDATVSQADAKRVLDTALVSLRSLVTSGEEVVLNGVGKFTKKTRAARNGVNPSTRKPIKIEATEAVVFKPAKEFKDILNP